MHLLEKLYQDTAQPSEEGTLSQEVIRFQSTQKRVFPATDISRIKQKTDGQTKNITQRSEIIQIILNFMGLYGVDSPLPDYFSEMIATLDDDSDEPDPDNVFEDGIQALRGFLDIFNHRIYSLYYRSWKKYRYHLQFESGGRDEFSQYILSFFGLGTPALQDLVGVDVSRLISYAGILGQRKRSAIGLKEILSDYFGGIGAEIIEFMPRWVVISKQYRACLGIGSDGIQARLGENLTVGEKIKDLAGKFRVVLEPLKLDIFRRFLPGGTDYQKLYRLVRFYAPDQLSFDVELLLEKGEVPPLQLGAKSAQLGWTTWLGKPDEEPISVVFSARGTDG